MSVRVQDSKMITMAMARLRAQPPLMLAEQPTSMVDFAHGTDELPPTDAVLITGETIKVVVRPSGTEPKLKCYLEAHLSVPRDVDVVATRGQCWRGCDPRCRRPWDLTHLGRHACQTATERTRAHSFPYSRFQPDVR